MRTINKVIFHCTATKEGQAFTVRDIDSWHKARGFKFSFMGVTGSIGYHYVIYLDGSIHVGRPIELAGAHTVGQNLNSIGICYIGGLDANGKPKDTRTPAQIAAMETLVRELKEKYPKATFHGHNEFANKACPCFDVQQLVKEISSQDVEKDKAPTDTPLTTDDESKVVSMEPDPNQKQSFINFLINQITNLFSKWIS